MKLDVGKPTYDYNYRHDHGLILNDDDDDHGINISQELVWCNVCIQPIYPPFYACPRSQSDECHFHLHRQCSEILSRASYPKQKPKQSLCSLFYCRFCGIPSNGLIYYFSSNIKDISCLSAPRFVKHESHRQHVLYHFDVSYRFDKRRTLNCCSTPDKFWYAYACVDCDFAIHVHCAFMPKRVEHKFDVHPLDLITTSIIKDTTNSSDYFCEFCEEDIDTRFWYYGCEECNNLFHIKCIPSIGYLSKVKFGNSITVPCHPHQVTFVRMLGYGSQTCGYCKEIIQGFVDDMAFHCSECDFWMHFGCAEECTGTEKFKPGERTIR